MRPLKFPFHLTLHHWPTLLRQMDRQFLSELSMHTRALRGMFEDEPQFSRGRAIDLLDEYELEIRQNHAKALAERDP